MAQDNKATAANSNVTAKRQTMLMALLVLALVNPTNANNANNANNASTSKSNDIKTSGSANSNTRGWTIVLGLVLFVSLIVVSCFYFKSKKRKDTKEAPTVAIEVTTHSANPLDEFRLSHRVDHQVLEMVENPSGLPARRQPKNQRATGTSSLPTATLCLLFISLISVDVIDGHNWIANPKSRIGGLGRTAPCPPRVGNDLHIAVRQSETFPIEWSDGHPGSFVYLTIVKREHEANLKELNVRCGSNEIKPGAT